MSIFSQSRIPPDIEIIIGRTSRKSSRRIRYILYAVYYIHVFLYSASTMRLTTVKNRFSTAYVELAKGSCVQNKFTTARRAGKEASALNGLVRPSCLIIDEVGHCEFDKENTRLFFNLIDRRYNKEGKFNIVFKSNKHLSHWRSNFNKDDTLLCALDRIFDDATLFNIKAKASVESGWRPSPCKPAG